MIKASSSRFIARVGTVAILMLSVGFGLAGLCQRQRDPQYENSNFFHSGLVLLAPCLINKFSSVLSIFKPQCGAFPARNQLVAPVAKHANIPME
ncbi:hypothetical protein J2W42_002800 [Rhizobium tibeticum]|uniref:Uncharacterized protein n=1 Tax=Rhizobium tibeticum TaxID=501024 RepID=A0A1H8R3W3_9HYPH|nr:hypothetical protein [Rhizobium tibeticum]MDP9809941.1 hypothetical protein [Rhizobium tibeticum]SEI05457.1 hypothetical protein RTCCBAU85039_4039 [Rhizobium tibeticum]SEO60991.1 hypothetical protein SAMN05216228_1020102 [Rhizobium tibeticum]